MAVADLLDRALDASVVLGYTDVGYAVRRRTLGFRDLDTYDLTGRTVVVTGGNSGLGYATAEQLLRCGANVLVTVRSTEKGDDTVRRLVAATGRDDVTFGVLDLASLASVRDFAATVQAHDLAIDTLVHNAGAMFDDRRETADGIERTAQVHVVAPFLLTSLLLDHLGAQAPARVLTVSSGGMYAERLRVRHLQSPDDYAPAKAYARAKRAQVVLARQWAARHGDRGIRFHALHPGWAETPGVSSSLPVFERVMGARLRDPAEGADTTVWLVADEAALASNGDFWHDRRRRSTHKLPTTRHDPAEEDRLWDEVTRLAGAEGV